ncbi:YicC/YloC family endoribonuclease [Anaeromyxobacter sp. SG17]|uniref:YicC/YloC family endoribonuclease n=1 Tax=Anaeromyxobacter sp. SG17 TaxID=2925405 RepID=UPI001F56528F|nr:YicC/YloC family endoribonuclease [Anaeromyxobacter sp. SG17]
MIRSMTGYGAGHGAAAGEELDVEVRSVNHKFCEVKVRLPREYAALELEAAKAVKDRLARGSVDVSIRRAAGAGGLAPRVDVQLAEAYARAFAELQVRLGLAAGATLADILAADGVVRLDERDVNLDGAREALRAGLGAALEALVEMRAREGEALARDLAARLATVEALAARVAVLAPQAVEHHRARLEERLAELTRGVALDPARLAQEVALLADRSDVAEELTRLASHAAQVRALLGGGEPAGRKLDFLVQEMHREVNTVGSKSQSAEIAGVVVALKAEIERMREQVQNVE